MIFKIKHKQPQPKTLLSIKSRKSVVKGSKREKLCLISVCIYDKEYVIFSDINTHYMITEYPLHVFELLKEREDSEFMQLFLSLNQSEENFFEVNGQYYPIWIVEKILRSE